MAQATLLRAGDTVSAWPWGTRAALFWPSAPLVAFPGELTPAPSKRLVGFFFSPCI